MISSITSSSQYLSIQGQNGKIDPFSSGSRQEQGSSNAVGKRDEVQVSDEARKMFASSQSEKGSAEESVNGLTAEEQAEVDRLQAIDRRVRAHEQAHVAAGGNLITKGASFEYESGPDGKRYAVAGEVSIDVSAEADPEATQRKMARVRAAAMAPADPSPQDRRVAAEAASTAREASMEISNEETDQSLGNSADEVSENSAVAEQPAKATTSDVVFPKQANEDKRIDSEITAGTAAADDNRVAAQFPRSMMASAAMAYQNAFHLTEPAINRTVFA